MKGRTLLWSKNVFQIPFFDTASLIVFNIQYFYGRQECNINPLNAELNPIRHLLALVGAPHILHVSTVRVKNLL